MDRRNALTLLTLLSAAPAVALARTESSSDSDYAERTLAVGTVALKTSELAQSHAKDDWVKRFANYEVAEQATVADVLKTLGARPERSEKAAEMVDKLKKSSNFDADYLAAQLDGHRQLLKIQDDFISSGKSQSYLDVAQLARTQIKEHIDLLETIQKTLRS